MRKEILCPYLSVLYHDVVLSYLLTLMHLDHAGAWLITSGSAVTRISSVWEIEAGYNIDFMLLVNA